MLDRMDMMPTLERKTGLRVKVMLIALAALLLSRGDCVAGTGGTNVPLPPSVSYAGELFNGHDYSSMCIACHTENPSAQIQKTGFPNSESATDYVGSHFVRNTLDGLADTYTTNNTAIEKLDAWSSGAVSKYGKIGFLVNEVPGTAGEMICQSCHNLLQNSGYKLLVDAYDEAAGDMTLCLGCHGALSSDVPILHHPLSNGFATVGSDVEDSTMHEVDTGHSSHVRVPTGAEDAQTQDVNYSTTGGKLVCSSCHKPHNAMTSTGARILRRGNLSFMDHGGTPQADKPINVTYADGTVLLRVPTGFSSETGLYRESDMDDGFRLVYNFDPLCGSCH